MSGGAAVKLASISDLPFEMVETLIFDGLLQLQSKRCARRAPWRGRDPARTRSIAGEPRPARAARLQRM